ncbi:MAG: adenylate/guanylate cyclase domain-containing protein [Turneriella sp.]|nr:adenylate/guanylate cyclase domain-containing protein [Turneriella sp.]
MKPISVAVPANWNNYLLPDGKEFGAHGFGTFSTKLSGLKVGEEYAVEIHLVTTAHRIFIGDSAQPLCGVGLVATTKEEYKPDYRHVLCRFKATAETVRLTIQVANFWHPAGGLRAVVFFGPEQAIWKRYLVEATFTLGIIAFLLASIIFLLLSYFTHAEDTRPLFMVGLAVAMLVNVSSDNLRVARELFDFYDYFIQLRLNIAILPMGAAAVLAYVANWQKDARLQKLAQHLSLANFILFVLYLLLPFKLLMQLYFPTLAWISILVVLNILFTAHIFWKARHAVPWDLAISILPVTLAALTASLTILLGLKLPSLEPFAFLLFVLSESVRNIAAMGKTLRERRQVLRQNKATLKRLALFIPQEHIRKLGSSKDFRLAPGQFYHTEACIMFLRVEPDKRANLDMDLLVDIYASLSEEICNYAQTVNGNVDRLSAGRYILSFTADPAVALRFAVQMRNNVRFWGESIGHYLIYRCGIHYGPVVWGIYGSPERWAGGYIGDSANTAARLETLCARYRTGILLSQDAYFRSAHYDEYLIRMLEPVYLKGKNEHIFVYEVLTGLPAERLEKLYKTLPVFGRGLQAFLNKDFAKAIPLFEKVVAEDPADFPAKLYLERAQKLLQTSTDTEWDPIEVLTKK